MVYYIRKENRRLWQRNAAVALGNLGDPDKAPALLAALDNPDPFVRVHAVWALGKLGGPKARAAIGKVRKTDESEQVREEIEKTLEDS